MMIGPERNLLISILLLSLMICSFSADASAGREYERGSVKIQSALFMKVLGFNRNLEGAISVYVMAADEFAGEFRTLEGEEIGGCRLESVTKGKGLPAERPDIIYIGDDADIDEALYYTEENSVMSISGTPDFIGRGVSLIIAIEDGKPVLIIDTEGSIREGVQWSKAMIRISEIH